MSPSDAIGYELLRSTKTVNAVWVDKESVEQVAKQCGGEVEVISSAHGPSITRITFPYAGGAWSLPVGFWLTDDNKILNDEEWERVDDDGL